MADLSQVEMVIGKDEISTKQISKKDKEILRNLAERVKAISKSEQQEEKRKLWYDLNELKPRRPVILCDPENAWNEIIPKESCVCENSFARNIEAMLRKLIFWGESMGDDRVIDDVFHVPYVVYENNWGLPDNLVGSEQYGHAYTWEPHIKDYEKDFEKLRMPVIEIDQEASERLLQIAKDAIGDFLTVRQRNIWWWSFGLTHEMILMRGMEKYYFDLFDYPDQVHRLMSFLMEGTMRRIDYLEQNNLLTLNNGNTYVGSGGFGFTNELPQKDFSGHVRTIDMWGFSESQETVSMSPAMFEEFVFQYQLPILERFGLNCYGCCEPLHKRWEIVKKTPRLRRVSVSPWADTVKMAEYLENKYIYSYKPNPAYLAVEAIDEELIRKQIREVLKVTKGCCVELIMKDNNTLCGNSQNVVNWCRIAREEIENA